MTPKGGAGRSLADRFSLKRWSRRKREAARVAPAPVPAPTASSPSAVPTPTPPASSSAAPATAADLPPIESLTIESDFTAFLKPQVEETVKRAALKQLFRDPRFNLMDGLDTYIDDYTRADPIPPEMLERLAHARFILDQPATELTSDGPAVKAVAAAGMTPDATAARVAAAEAAPSTAATEPAVGAGPTNPKP